MIYSFFLILLLSFISTKALASPKPSETSQYQQHPGRTKLADLDTYQQHPGRTKLADLDTYQQHPGRTKLADLDTTQASQYQQHPGPDNLADLDTYQQHPGRNKLADLDTYQQHPGRDKLADLETCGFSMWNGYSAWNTELDKLPWMVKLGYRRKGLSGQVFKCGGTLIGPRYVLTAANCVSGLPKSYTLSVVRVGEGVLSTEKNRSESGDMAIEKVIWHQEYNRPQRLHNDIAIIKLAKDVVDNHVSPVCLPWVHDQDEDYLENRPSIPKCGELKVIEDGKCRKIYESWGSILTGEQICAGGENGQDSCVVDRGSGLVRVDPQVNPVFDQWILVGVNSFGPSRQETDGIPGVYTRVQNYLEWILDTVQNN